MGGEPCQPFRGEAEAFGKFSVSQACARRAKHFLGDLGPHAIPYNHFSPGIGQNLCSPYHGLTSVAAVRLGAHVKEVTELHWPSSTVCCSGVACVSLEACNGGLRQNSQRPGVWLASSYPKPSFRIGHDCCLGCFCNSCAQTVSEKPEAQINRLAMVPGMIKSRCALRRFGSGQTVTWDAPVMCVLMASQRIEVSA